MSGHMGGSTRLGSRSLRGPLPGMLAQVTELAGGIALLSSPDAYTVATVGGDGVCTAPNGERQGGEVDLGRVYEARAFTPDVELRWVRRGDSGQGVLLGEQVTGGNLWTDLQTTDLRYLLWGEVVDGDNPAGWVSLSAARIGTLRVPAVPPRGRRLRLRAREYIAVEPDHGNSYVLDERLIAIEEGQIDE